MVATPIAMEAAKAHVHPIVLKDVLVVEPHVTVVVPQVVQVVALAADTNNYYLKVHQIRHHALKSMVSCFKAII